MIPFVHSSSQYHESNDQASGVMALDITLPYLYEHVLNAYPACLEPNNRRVCLGHGCVYMDRNCNVERSI